MNVVFFSLKPQYEQKYKGQNEQISLYLNLVVLVSA
jgi:hypothetical protein